MATESLATRRAASTSGRVIKNRDIVRSGQSRRINDLLLEKGWSQSDLARATGLARYTISRAVRGENVLGPKIVGAIARALAVDPASIVNGDVRDTLDDLPVGVNCNQLGDGRVWLRVNVQTCGGNVHTMVESLLGLKRPISVEQMVRALAVLQESSDNPAPGNIVPIDDGRQQIEAAKPQQITRSA